VFSLGDRPSVISIPFAATLLQNTFHIWDIQTTQRFFLFAWTIATPGVNKWANEALVIIFMLKIVSQAETLIKQILSFLARGGSYFIKAMNQKSFQMRRIFRIEVEILVSVDRFSEDFGGSANIGTISNRIFYKKKTILAQHA
jgi:hypothetical protein